MGAVTGTVTSSKPISVSKASSILSRFAAADIGARREVAAYLNRAANAFEDLVQLHRKLRREKREMEHQVEAEVETTSRRKKKKENEGERLRAEENGDLAVNVVETRKRKTSEEERRDLETLRILENGNLAVNIEKKLSTVKVEVKVEEEGREDWSEERIDIKDKKRKHLSIEQLEGEVKVGGDRREKKKRKIKTEE